MLSLPLAAATTIAIENHKADARSRSMQWNWGLDGYNAPEWHQLRRGDAEQQVTRNALNRMLTGPGEPRVTQSWMPSSTALLAVGIAAVLVLRAWISSRMAP